ncbi:MAG: FecR domain-containing protein [Cyclobacteriaceae bacterium]|nr:FecR domain-containing protein [Cyclobacteriaceae bacterium]
MSKLPYDINELIGKYLHAETTLQEAEWLLQWRKEDEANEKYFNQLKTIFERAAQVKSVRDYNTNAAWQKVAQHIHQKKSRTLFPTQFLRYAAAISVLFISGWLLYQQFFKVERLNVTAQNAIVKDTLPDGTTVVLNKQSALAIEIKRGGSKKMVKLKGEAKFIVNNEKSDELIVQAGETFIKDIGTVFNVKAYPEQNTVEVTVLDGEVIFYTEEQVGITLKAGMKGLYNKNSKSFAIDKPDTNVVAYANRNFVFEETSLGEVVLALNAIYEKPIKLDDAIKNCKVTVSFEGEEIETIAEIIAETLGLTVENNVDFILLKGKACQ